MKKRIVVVFIMLTAMVPATQLAFTPPAMACGEFVGTGAVPSVNVPDYDDLNCDGEDGGAVGPDYCLREDSNCYRAPRQ